MPGDEPLALLQTTTGKLVVANFATGKITATFDAGRTGLTGPILFAPDGKSFAVVFHSEGYARTYQAEEVRVYSWPKAELLHTFTGHADSVTCLAFSPDSKTLASGSLDTTVLLWDLAGSK